MLNLEQLITESYAHREQLTPGNASAEIITAVNVTIADLEAGRTRVAQKIDGVWQTHTWVKQAVLLYFRLNPNRTMPNGLTTYYDKIPLQFPTTSAQEFSDRQIRIVPTACVRSGAYIGPKTIVMPSFINIGAYVGNNCMIDTWATVGSCAQIGNNVHISGGAGIGGVLEPLQAAPTIIEDDCFIGARSEIVEGVIVESGAVISMGVFIGQSTKIYDRARDEITYGRVPAGSVVIPGNLPAANGKYSTYCAVIIKTVDAKTKAKVGLNQLLRD